MRAKLPILVCLLCCLASCLFAYSLEELDAKMAAGNPDVLRAREEAEASLLDVRDAKWGYAPKIDFTLTGTYLFDPIEPIVLEKDSLLQMLGLADVKLGPGEDYLTVFKGQENMMYKFDLQIVQPVFTWGKIPKSVKLFETVHEAKALRAVQLTEQNSVELRSRLAALVYMGEMRTLLQEEADLARKLVSLSEQARVNGMLLELDVKQASVQASQIGTALAELESQISDQLTAVARLCALDSLSLEEIGFKPDPEKHRALLKRDLEKMRTDALDPGRTTFKLLGKLEAIANLAKDIAGASVNWKPDVALVANLSYSGSRLPLVETDWYRKDRSNSTLTLAVKVNVLDGGKAVRDVKRAKSNVATAQIDTTKARSELLGNLETSLNRIKLADSKLSYYDCKVETDLENVKRQEDLLEAGAGSEIDVLKAELEVRKTKLERIQEEIALAGAYYTATYIGG